MNKMKCCEYAPWRKTYYRYLSNLIKQHILYTNAGKQLSYAAIEIYNTGVEKLNNI